MVLVGGPIDGWSGVSPDVSEVGVLGRWARLRWVFLAAAVMVLWVARPVAAFGPVLLDAGDSYEFTVVQGDLVRLIGDDAAGQIVVSHRHMADVVSDVSCSASRPRLQLKHNELLYTVTCSQRKP